MIKEYLIAALLYDLERHCIHCTLVRSRYTLTNKMARVNGQWVCFSYIKSRNLPYPESMLAPTLVEIATQ